MTSRLSSCKPSANYDESALRTRFDHCLYYQSILSPEGDAASVLKPTRDYERLVAGAAPVYRRELRGELPNLDTWIRLNG